MDYEAYADKFGTVNSKGVEIAIAQLPYIDSNDWGDFFYTAVGQDRDGNEYQINWPVKDIYMDDDGQYDLPQDESDCCDWEIYTVRSL